MKVQIKDIIIGERQRIDLGDIDDLMDSLTRLGQIHNIGLTSDNRLIWGRRRLEAATRLGWTEIEATKRDGLSYHDEQTIELEEDLKRKDRTWQEKCLAISKLYAIKKREGTMQFHQQLADYLGVDRTYITYSLDIADGLLAVPKDEPLWACTGLRAAFDILKDRREAEALKEIERRRSEQSLVAKQVEQLKQSHPQIFEQAAKQSNVQVNNSPAPAAPKVMSLRERADAYNKAFEHLGPPNTSFFYVFKSNREFIYSFWFVGGANISDLYGAYQVEYLKRITTLFPDRKKVVHLFVGSLPPSSDYIRVGLTQGDNKPDVECDAHNLSTGLPFKPDIIYADPPYSIEDSEHYDNSMVNRDRVIQECGIVLEPGGFLVWLDQALPIFSNDVFQFVGAIGYVRSTGNRFRMITILRKHSTPCPLTTSTESTKSLPSPKPPAPSSPPASPSTGQ